MAKTHWMALGIAAVALAGCIPASRTGVDTSSHPAAAAIAPESITYETGPCFGQCPVYKVMVTSDGKGIFTGVRNTEVIGERKFTVTVAQYLAFRDVLLPFLPDWARREYRPGTPLCEQAATDMPSVAVDRSVQMRTLMMSHLYFYFGCDMEKNRPMAEALGNAPNALPIQNLIGEHP
ncbi:DUF6438 domain-containing protein [Sphingomonas sp. DT-207]|uniref:DUF6438 domain-containing protein n=1 Tax=Sphingomonas sp. DT-207 TaxID=3396167 RepID=UPI003F1DB562